MVNNDSCQITVDVFMKHGQAIHREDDLEERSRDLSVGERRNE